MSAATTTLPTNDLMSPPTNGPFQLVVQAVAKSDEDAEVAFKMVKAIQKRALSNEEPKTMGVSVDRMQ